MTIQRYDWSSEVQPANAHARSSLPGTNSGHGHAWPRPDGIKARCGGVGLCKICSADALLVKVSISEPAQPEPVAEEMPEAVSVNTWQLEELLKYADLAEVSLRTGFHPPEFLFEPADRSLRQCIDAIKEQRDQWRVHAARPARAVAMTEELERVLDAAEAHSGWHMDQGRPESFDEIDAAIAAVRSQAAEAVDASAIYDKGFADGIALQKKCAAEAGKVPDCVIHAVRLRRSYLCDLPNSDYGKEQALEMRTIEDWLRAAEGRK